MNSLSSGCNDSTNVHLAFGRIHGCVSRQIRYSNDHQGSLHCPELLCSRDDSVHSRQCLLQRDIHLYCIYTGSEFDRPQVIPEISYPKQVLADKNANQYRIAAQNCACARFGVIKQNVGEWQGFPDFIWRIVRLKVDMCFAKVADETRAPTNGRRSIPCHPRRCMYYSKCGQID